MAKLFEIVGKTISGEWGNDDETGDGIPVLRTTNFTNEGIINYSKVVTRTIPPKNLSHKFLQKGDIIIEKSGGSDKQPVGRVVFFEGEDGKYLFNNFTGLLRVKDQTRWYPRYVFYALFSNYLRGGTLQYQNKTTGLHNLKTEQYVQDAEIREIPICNQKEIADILDRVNNIIHKRHQQLDKLDQLIKSQFIEMFGDPIANPMNWETSRLTDLGSCKNGMNFHANDSGIELNCLGVGDFKDLAVIADTYTLPKVSLNEEPSEEYLLHDGDIVFVRSNGNKMLVGRCLAVYPREIKTTFSGFCIRYRLASKEVNTMYLLHLLKTNSARQKLVGRGANIQNLNQKILGDLLIPVPPIKLQNEFASFIQQADKSKFAIQQSLEQLETLKKSLMQEYFG